MEADSIWKEQAERVIAIHGAAKARQITRQARDNNTPGTASYAFHNAVLRFIDRAVQS